METIADYKARILSYIEGNDPLEVQSKTPELLADLVISVPEEKLNARPSPTSGRWQNCWPTLLMRRLSALGATAR